MKRLVIKKKQLTYKQLIQNIKNYYKNSIIDNFVMFDCIITEVPIFDERFNYYEDFGNSKYKFFSMDMSKNHLIKDNRFYHCKK